jgi:hypothetical protein
MKRVMMFLLMSFFSLGVSFAQSPHSTTFTWAWSQGSGDPATGFHIWRTAGSSCAPIVAGAQYATVASPIIFDYVDTAVVGGNIFSYLVTAYNATGDSAPDTTGCVTATTPLNVPPAPTNLQGTAK